MSIIQSCFFVTLDQTFAPIFSPRIVTHSLSQTFLVAFAHREQTLNQCKTMYRY